jgi:hypothetical protein
MQLTENFSRGGSLKIIAELRWLSPEEGGRRQPPPDGGIRYSTLSRFAQETDEQHRKEAWSLIVDLLEPANAAGVQRGCPISL